MLRPAKSGGVSLSVRQAAGYEFVAHENVSGFVQDARAMLRVLSQLNMPRRWFRVWLALLSLQEYENSSWELRISQAELSETCNVPRSGLRDPLDYFEAIGWIYRPRRALILLNPWLTSCGNSNKQAEAQASWLIYGPKEFIIPGREHPEEWLAVREYERRQEVAAAAAATAEDAQLFTLPFDAESASEALETETEETAETVVLRYRDRAAEADTGASGEAAYDAGLTAQRVSVARSRVSVTGSVRKAMDELGSEVELSRIEKWLADKGIAANPRTLASAVSRERSRRRVS